MEGTNMKYVIMLLTALFVTGCGTNYYHEIIKEIQIEVEIEVAQKFEGSYIMEEISTGLQSGPLEIIVAYDGEIEVYQASNNDKLVSQNFNGSVGTHPLIRFNNTFANEELCFVKNLDVNYSGSDDLEEDDTTNNLGSGKHFTTYKFCLVDDILTLNTRIYNGSLRSSGDINSVVIERSFTSY